MKFFASFLVVLLFTFAGLGQRTETASKTRVIAKSDYDAVHNYAVQATNAAFPFVFTVITDTLEKGKVVSTETEIDERGALSGKQPRVSKAERPYAPIRLWWDSGIIPIAARTVSPGEARRSLYVQAPTLRE